MNATRRTDRPIPADADLEQLSAWLDGELEPDVDAVMLDRLKTDPDLRAQFEWFNLAGDALRSHEVAACHRPQLVEQVRCALDSEPVRVAPGALSASKLRRHLAAGITVVAAAGVLAVVALPQLRGTDLAPATPAAAPMAVAGRLPGAPAAAPNALAARSPQLDAYFRAHRELATNGVMPSAAAYIRMSTEPDR
jgi:negative regulator of sigma E activity